MKELSADRTYFTRLVNTYSRMLLRIAFTYMKNTSDSEDIVQDVFLSLYANPPKFANTEHEKAWLIRCTINRCKNQLNSYWFRNTQPLDENLSFFPEEESAVLLAVMKLPEKYRTVLHLHYGEGYSIEEIAGILMKKPATVGTWLARGRAKLKTALKGGFDDE